MKYILTNKPQKINETKGEIQNVSVRHVIVLAAGTSIPSVDTSTITVRPGESYPFKTVLGEVLYAWIINANDDETLEVSVINFPSEGEGGDTDISAIEREIINQGKQIQNLSKKLPSGTILAVDYRKGVTAQDFEGNLIKPNGIETTIGHDNGVFYNSDGGFQGQRDRAKGLWAGIGTENLSEIHKIDTTLLEEGVKLRLTERAIIVEEGDVLHFSMNTSEKPVWNPSEDRFCFTISTNLGQIIPFGAAFFGRQGEWIVPSGVTGISKIELWLQYFSGEYNFKIDDIIIEKSPIATPFCEKTRGEYQISYPCDLDLGIDSGFVIKEFYGKYKKGINTTENYCVMNVGNDESSYRLLCTANYIDEFISLLSDEKNIMILNFSGGIITNISVNSVTMIVNRFTILTSVRNPSGVLFDSEVINYMPNNYSTKIILGKGRNLTDEEISLYTNSDIEIPDVGEYYPIAFSKKRADQYGTTKRGWKVVSTDEDIFEIKGKKYKITGNNGVETTVIIDGDGVKTGTSLDQVNGYLRVNESVVLPCDVEVL